jgi:hypothetical protein
MFRLRGQNFPLSFAFNGSTTRSLTSVRAERKKSLRMNMTNLSLVLVFAGATTRSLTGVYAELNEVLEMTDFGIGTTGEGCHFERREKSFSCIHV